MKKIRNSSREWLKTLIVLFILFAFNYDIFALQNAVLLDASKKQLIVPLKNIQSKYSDNTSQLSEIEYNDAYYAEVADQVAFNELSKRFNSIQLLTDTNDINKIYSVFSYKADSGVSVNTDSLQKVIQSLAEHYKVDFVIIPAYCLLQYKSIHQKNWRDGRGGSSYERPVSITASAEYQIQFYYKDGLLKRESKGTEKSGKPLFYSVFKKKNLEKNIVSNSKKRYAPPLLRSMSKSITQAINKL